MTIFWIHFITKMPTIHVVDDDKSVRDSLNMVLTAADMNCKTYGSAEEFLDTYHASDNECLLLDIRMSGMSGTELQQVLPKFSIKLPVILMTGYGDIATAVKAMKAGAVDFIEKPFHYEDIVNRLRQCMKVADIRQKQENVFHVLHKSVDRLALLSQREREVFDLLVQGKINKVIGNELGISTRTVEAHRAKIMEKLELKSPFEIARVGILAASMASPE